MGSIQSTKAPKFRRDTRIHSAVNREIAVRDSFQMLSVFRAIELVSVLNGVVSSSACALIYTVPCLHCALQNNCGVDATRSRLKLPTYILQVLQVLRAPNIGGHQTLFCTGVRLNHLCRHRPNHTTIDRITPQTQAADQLTMCQQQKHTESSNQAGAPTHRWQRWCWNPYSPFGGICPRPNH